MSSGKRFLFRPRLEALEDRCVPTAGALDTTFGVGGKVLSSFLTPSYDFGLAGTAIQADGKIVQAGYSLTPAALSLTGGGGGAALVRYNTDGTLDTTFGTGGKVLPDYSTFGGNFYAVAIQGDGKIVMAGVFFPPTFGIDLALLRYNSNGTLDTTFGSGGEVLTGGDGAISRPESLAIQADGKIVAAGQGANGFALARYNPDGSLDTSFGSGGEVNTSLPGTAGGGVSSIAIQTDGRIVALGTVFNTQTNLEDFALARYNTDGSLDTTFGSGGEVTTDFAGIFQFAGSVTLQSDGKIVAAGSAAVPGSTGSRSDFGLARYNPDGSLDTTFGVGGKVTTDFGSTSNGASADAVKIQGDGCIVALGISAQGLSNNPDGALARYNSDGSLDTTFGSGGKVITDFGSAPDYALSMALQSDGRIVAAGETIQPATGYDFAVTRYTTSGALDTTFGSGGKVITNLGLVPAETYGRAGVAVQADGKLVVAGGADRGFSSGGLEFAVARYNTNGTLDTSFGSGGQVGTSFPGQALATSEVIQPDGKIVLAGSTFVDNRRSDFALVRYNPDGSLDTTFGTGGRVDTDFGPYSVDGNSVALQADGKIVVVGDVGGSQGFSMARYNPNGTLDTSFGTGGKILTVGTSPTGFNSVAIQSDGKIVAAGETVVQKNVDFALLRYNSDGSLDTSFGSKGEVLTSFGGSGDEAYGLAVQSDGKIVAGGFSGGQADGQDFALARYNSDGSPDKNFGNKGQVLTNFNSGTNWCLSLALQGDGKIVAAGFSFQGSTGQDFSLARYNYDGSLDQSFGNGGLVLTDFGNGGGVGSQAVGVAIQTDGNIVAAGTSFQNGPGFEFALARYIGVSPTTPTDAIVGLLTRVEGLVTTGVLTNGQGNALEAKLQQAIEHLADGATATAANDLQAFVNEVNDFIGQDVLSSAVGQPLIDDANLIIALLTKK
jgi:uncharacterized delta-60 repeat protein